MSAALSALEEKVIDRVRSSRDELVALATALIACDTTARTPTDPPRDEARLQHILEDRLRALKAETDLWEPEAVEEQNPFMIPAGLSFSGRPQLVARIPGTGGGPSLLLNGHIDAVDVAPREQWSSDPFHAEVRDNRLYGRGANDMKGGLASLVVALEALQQAGVRLAGDIVFCSNTDEESSGAGGLAIASRGIRADAGICAEPTGFDIWVACRGATTGVMSIEGRAGHAEVPQPHWQEGGAVNAIEKTVPLLQAIQRLRDDWRGRPDCRHALLSAPSIVPTLIRGGTWLVTYPASCDVTLDVQYLPRSDEPDPGGRVRAEIMESIAASAASDPWLREHAPTWQWVSDCPPAEVPADHPILAYIRGVSADVGRSSELAGLDSWHDAATFTLFAGTPTVSFGPGGTETAHAVDEYVPLDDLVDFSSAVAVIAMRWCGVHADS